mmetsp:Transcript_39838/g.85004  ORF Transcript_39838/g.85004 Transcript_39838/m.85004 type:complete len:261 (+) Transcript_39838:268-1050(+)
MDTRCRCRIPPPSTRRRRAGTGQRGGPPSPLWGARRCQDPVGGAHLPAGEPPGPLPPPWAVTQVMTTLAKPAVVVVSRAAGAAPARAALEVTLAEPAEPRAARRPPRAAAAAGPPQSRGAAQRGVRKCPRRAPPCFPRPLRRRCRRGTEGPTSLGDGQRLPPQAQHAQPGNRGRCSSHRERPCSSRDQVPPHPRCRCSASSLSMRAPCSPCLRPSRAEAACKASAPHRRLRIRGRPPCGSAMPEMPRTMALEGLRTERKP